jgi:hypothetical protein
MHLSSMRYLEADPHLPPTGLPIANAAAWAELSKGLVAVLSGYVLGIVSATGWVALLWFTTGGFRKRAASVTGDDLTALLVLGVVLTLIGTYGGYLVLRGKWRCALNAPEARHARWFVFASLVCVYAGPAISFAARFVGEPERASPPAAAGELQPTVARTAVGYAERLRESGPSSRTRLLGAMIAPLGPVFFVLFMRAVHDCLGGRVGVRLAELYLLFTGLLMAGSLSLLLDPRVRLRFDLLVIVAAACLVATVAYFALILGTVFSITAHLNQASARQRP